MSFKIGTIESNLSSKNFIPGAPIALDVVVLQVKNKDEAKSALTRIIKDFNDYFGFYDEVLSAHYKAVYESTDLTEISFVTDSIANVYLPEFLSLARNNKNIGYCKYMAIKKLNDFYNRQGVVPIVTASGGGGAGLNGLGGFWQGVWKWIKPALVIAAAVVGTVLTGGALGIAISYTAAATAAAISLGVGVAASFIANPNQNLGEALNNALPNFINVMASVAGSGNVDIKNLTSNGSNDDMTKVYDFIQENSDSLSTEYLAGTDFKKEENSFLPLLVAGAGVFALVN